MKREGDKRLGSWLALSQLKDTIEAELEKRLKSENDLTLNEFYVLYHLSAEETKKMRLQQLQEKVGLSQSALSRLIVRMEEKNCGVITRHNCVEDKRGIYVGITERGEQLLHKAEATVEDVLKKILPEPTILKNMMG